MLVKFTSSTATELPWDTTNEISVYWRCFKNRNVAALYIHLVTTRWRKPYICKLLQVSFYTATATTTTATTDVSNQLDFLA